jgi:hypothetical protein
MKSPLTKAVGFERVNLYYDSHFMDGEKYQISFTAL